MFANLEASRHGAKLDFVNAGLRKLLQAEVYLRLEVKSFDLSTQEAIGWSRIIASLIVGLSSGGQLSNCRLQRPPDFPFEALYDEATPR